MEFEAARCQINLMSTKPVAGHVHHFQFGTARSAGLGHKFVRVASRRPVQQGLPCCTKRDLKSSSRTRQDPITHAIFRETVMGDKDQQGETGGHATFPCRQWRDRCGRRVAGSVFRLWPGPGAGCRPDLPLRCGGGPAISPRAATTHAVLCAFAVEAQRGCRRLQHPRA